MYVPRARLARNYKGWGPAPPKNWRRSAAWVCLYPTSVWCVWSMGGQGPTLQDLLQPAQERNGKPPLHGKRGGIELVEQREQRKRIAGKRVSK